MTRPNILFLIDDQHRYDWLGCAGASWMHTPNLDRLAGEGRRYTHCYTNSPVCGPARVALASGLMPTRTGALSNPTAFLPVSTPNMYRHFRDHGGYRVSLVGRHDLAKPGAPASVYGNRPLNFSYGFTEAFEVEGAMAVSGRPRPNGPYGQHLVDHGLWETYRQDYRDRAQRKWILGASHDSVLPDAHHQDVFVADRAIERIEGIERDYPWFMFVSFQGPHDPFDPPGAFGRMYREARIPPPQPMPEGAEPQRVKAFRRIREVEDPPIDAQVQEARRQYAAKITTIDAQVGRILDALDHSGQADRTIVVFCSDHGEMAGDRRLWIKHTAYEPSWRVPLIMRGPGIAQGTSDALVELIDLNPTLGDLADLPAQPGLDACSFAGTLDGTQQEHRSCVVTVEADMRTGRYQAVRTRERKLIITDNDVTEFYDMATDPLEQHNQFEGRHDDAADLHQRLRDRLTERGPYR